MHEFLFVASSVLSLAASLVTIVEFFRKSLQRRGLLLALVLGLAIVAVLSWRDLEERRFEQEQSRRAAMELRYDASQVADAIVITGWEEAGDYVGYLSQITGFFGRHREQFPDEYSTYIRQLGEWQDYLQTLRSEGKTADSSEYRDLRGLVSSGRDMLRQIADR